MQNFKSEKCIETHIVGPLKEKVRLQDYGASIFESITTKSALKKSIKKGLISRNGELAKTSDWVEKGQVIQLYAENIQQEKKVFKLKLDVLFEDDYFAVIDKPSGFPTNGNYFKTIENALPYNLRPSSEKDKLAFPQPVHRLDNPTSGVLLIAKTVSMRTRLSMLFEKHKIQKSYVAIIEGQLGQEEGEIDLKIENKRCLTRYQVEKTFQKDGLQWSLVQLYPDTGRTHQLRIHLSSEGHPIVGDSIYGSKEVNGNLLLHASSLQFQHPKTEKDLNITTKFPHKFVKFIKELE